MNDSKYKIIEMHEQNNIFLRDDYDKKLNLCGNLEKMNFSLLKINGDDNTYVEKILPSDLEYYDNVLFSLNGKLFEITKIYYIARCSSDYHHVSLSLELLEIFKM